MSVNNGVREFSMPASELLIRVSALVNRKAGIAKPRIPTITSEGIFFPERIFIFLIINGKTNKKLKKILSAATWILLKDSRPFFMRMNELPQIIERISKVVSCEILLSNLMVAIEKP